MRRGSRLLSLKRPQNSVLLSRDLTRNCGLVRNVCVKEQCRKAAIRKKGELGKVRKASLLLSQSLPKMCVCLCDKQTVSNGNYENEGWKMAFKWGQTKYGNKLLLMQVALAWFVGWLETLPHSKKWANNAAGGVAEHFGQQHRSVSTLLWIPFVASLQCFLNWEAKLQFNLNYIFLSSTDN